MCSQNLLYRRLFLCNRPIYFFSIQACMCRGIQASQRRNQLQPGTVRMQSKASLSGRKLHYFRVSLMARKLVENPQVSILFCDNTGQYLFNTSLVWQGIRASLIQFLMARKLVENPQVSILFCDNTGQYLFNTSLVWQGIRASLIQFLMVRKLVENSQVSILFSWLRAGGEAHLFGHCRY